LRLAAYGVIAGLLISLELTRFMSGVLYGVHSADAMTFAGAFAFLMLIALAATYIPARRAMRTDPAVIFRAL
jgi:ABC-type lipoprotein release transport system permease subunit